MMGLCQSQGQEKMDRRHYNFANQMEERVHWWYPILLTCFFSNEHGRAKGADTLVLYSFPGIKKKGMLQLSLIHWGSGLCVQDLPL